jgi:hypothetical protein
MFFKHTQLIAQCTEAKDSEMAKYMELTKTKDAQGCSQCGILALYFCSAKYCITAEDKNKVNSMINATKENIIQMGQPYCCPEYLNKQPEWGIMSGESKASTNTNLNEINPSNSTSKLINDTNKIVTNANEILDYNNAVNATNKARLEVEKNKTISKNLKSKEEIEAEFKEKAAKINQSVDNVTENQKIEKESYLSIGIPGLNNSSAMPGISIGIDYLNNLDAEREKRKALEALEFQKVLAIQKLEMDKEEKKLNDRFDNSKNVTTKNENEINSIFKNYNSYNYELGITIKEAQIKHPAFFKKTLKPQQSDKGEFIISKKKLPHDVNPYAFFIKNDIIYGYKGLLYPSIMDPNFKEGFDITLTKINELENLFGFKPINTSEEDISNGIKTQKYTWLKNNKLVELIHTKKDLLMFQMSEVAIYVLDYSKLD